MRFALFRLFQELFSVGGKVRESIPVHQVKRGVGAPLSTEKVRVTVGVYHLPIKIGRQRG